MSHAPDPETGTAASTDTASHRHGAQWSLCKHEAKPKGIWIVVEMVLDCGCLLRAPDGETVADDLQHWAQFASEIRDQYGWNIQDKWGWCSYTSIDPVSGHQDTVHSVRVQRTTLTEAHRRP